ncbi:MAG: CoA transferase, partial [Eggerthellaceae bacterium]
FEVGNCPVAFGDWNSSNALAVGVLAALWNAERTGVGDKVVTSLYHVSNWGMMSALCAQQQGQPHPKNRAEAPCPTNNSYVTSDGVWFVMCFGNYNKFQLVFEHRHGSKYWEDPVQQPGGAGERQERRSHRRDGRLQTAPVVGVGACSGGAGAGVREVLR